MTAPVLLRHRPTERYGMPFTPETRHALAAWLAAGLGRERFSMTESHLAIETTQGDQARDVGLGAWVLQRQTREGFEFYPVEAEVIDEYRVVRRWRLVLRSLSRLVGAA